MDFLPAKKLGFGLMRMPLNDPANAADVDLDQVCRMVDAMLEAGFTYFDTAMMYHNFTSEDVAKKVLVDRHPRESFTLSTKLHAGFIRHPEDRDEVLASQLKKTGAGYFDYYLLHGIDLDLYPKYEKLKCFDWILEKKEQGLIRHAGCSFHGTPELLDEMLTKYPGLEFVQLQINYLDWESEMVRAKECYEMAVKHGKPVIVMEPAKGGTLANLPDEARELFKKLDPAMSPASWAIRFAASLPGVMLVLSGMSNMAQIEDNISYMKNFVPLKEEEIETCRQAAKIINSRIAIPCTGCGYCMEKCPVGIPIPKFFYIYNEDMRENLAEKGWTVNMPNYAILSKQYAPANECIKCRQCESVCPQHLPVSYLIYEVAEHYQNLQG